MYLSSTMKEPNLRQDLNHKYHYQLIIAEDHAQNTKEQLKKTRVEDLFF